jgi:hypothetical protein
MSEVPDFLWVLDQQTKQCRKDISPRATPLAFATLALAGHFVGKSLHWDRTKAWESSDQFFRNTNLDVITAEAIIWIGRIMGDLYTAEADNERPTSFLTASLTKRYAFHFLEDAIKTHTGVDFSNRAEQSREVYRADHILRERPKHVDDFVTTILRCRGCQSLAEPLKPVPRPSMVPLVATTQLTANVMIFFTTMPLGFYKTFKKFLGEFPDMTTDY